MANLLFRAATNAIDTSGTASTIQIAAPAGTALHDLGVIFYVSMRSAPDSAPTHTTPPGWFNPLTSTFSAGTFNGRISCYFRRQGAGAGAETMTSNVVASHIVHRGAWDNPHTLDLFDVIGSDIWTGTTATAPSLTTAENNEMLIFFAAAVDSGITWTPPTDFTERQDAAQSLLADRLFINKGATGTVSATASASSDGVVAMAAFNSDVMGWEVPPAAWPANVMAVVPSGMTPVG